MRRRAELPAGSVAAVILDASELAGRTPRRERRALTEGGPAHVVLGPRAPGGALSVGVTLAAAAALHAAVAAAAVRWANHARNPPVATTATAIRIEHIVDLPPPSPAAPRDHDAPVRPTASRVPSAARALPSSPAAPAAAAQVIAAAPEAADFTGFDIATGEGAAFAGGVTAPSGISTSAVHGDNVDRQARSGGETGSRARPVGLPATDWNCPWPAEAGPLAIDEETVIVRVIVRPDGSVLSASLVSDPGNGFGASALDCARAQTFQPAQDATGTALTAPSPPVRVRFTRSAR